MLSTVGQIIVDDALPPDQRGDGRTLDKAGLQAVLADTAQRHPEQYREVSHRLADIGWRAAQASGGYAFGLAHLQKSPAAAKIRQQLQGQIQQLINNDKLDDKTRDARIIKLVGAQMRPQQDAVFQEASQARNPLAMQVQSGARGNPMNLSSLIGSDMLYTDHRDQVAPIPILSSYSEGLPPEQYWAGTYGARKGVIDVKLSTQNAGYLGKLLNQVTHRRVVEDKDSPDEPEAGQPRGLPVETSDPDNEGALLAVDVGPYKRNTALTPKILQHLEQTGRKHILVRSPIVGGSPYGGVYARDVGVREKGVLPGRGEYPGLTAVQALNEPISQGSLSSKHSGGVAGEAKAVSGFAAIEAMINVPKHLVGGAVHSDQDGIVARIEDAPAGGVHVGINGQKHYVAADTPLKVKVGDTVEAGDVLSEGLPNPAKIVEHKGIGEGRRYFVTAFKDAVAGAGLKAHRRNVELLARGLINHVRLTDELGDYVPDDVVPYSTMEHIYQPRADARKLPPSQAKGKYLEKPVLHYSIGTPIRPSTINELERHHVKEVHVHDQPPPFEAEMIRGSSSLVHDPDWMTRMYGSDIKLGLLHGAQRGATSDERGSSFVPSIAKSVDFGRDPEAVTHKPEPGWQVDGFDSLLSGIKQGAAHPLEPGANAAMDGAGLPGGVKPLAPANPMSLTPSTTTAVKPQFQYNPPHAPPVKPQPMTPKPPVATAGSTPPAPPAPNQGTPPAAPAAPAVPAQAEYNPLGNPFAMGSLAMAGQLPSSMSWLQALMVANAVSPSAFSTLTRGPNGTAGAAPVTPAANAGAAGGNNSTAPPGSHVPEVTTGLIDTDVATSASPVNPVVTNVLESAVTKNEFLDAHLNQAVPRAATPAVDAGAGIWSRAGRWAKSKVTAPWRAVRDAYRAGGVYGVLENVEFNPATWREGAVANVIQAVDPKSWQQVYAEHPDLAGTANDSWAQFVANNAEMAARAYDRGAETDQNRWEHQWDDGAGWGALKLLANTGRAAGTQVANPVYLPYQTARAVGGVRQAETDRDAAAQLRTKLDQQIAQRNARTNTQAQSLPPAFTFARRFAKVQVPNPNPNQESSFWTGGNTAGTVSRFKDTQTGQLYDYSTLPPEWRQQMDRERQMPWANLPAH